MGAPHISDIQAYIKEVTCGFSGTITANNSGSGDNVAITGASIDRLGYGSAVFCIAYKTTLAASETLAFAVEYQESADGSNWDTATAIQASTVAATGALTGGLGRVTFPLNLEGKKRYIRFNFTPNLSASGTDTANVAGVAILGGSDALPVA